MNKYQLIIKRKQTESNYTVHGTTKFSKRKRNVININSGNTDAHEMEKTRVGLELLRQGHHFITEAKHKRTGLIHDVVDLDTGEIYEVESQIRRAVRFEEIQKSYNEQITIIALWKADNRTISFKNGKEVIIKSCIINPTTKKQEKQLVINQKKCGKIQK